MTLRDKLIVYIYRKQNELESERELLRFQVRSTPMDSLDMYEAMRSDVRISAWNEFISDLLNIILNCK